MLFIIWHKVGNDKIKVVSGRPQAAKNVLYVIGFHLPLLAWEALQGQLLLQSCLKNIVFF